MVGSTHLDDGQRGQLQGFASPHAQQFPVKRALRRQQGDFPAVVGNDHAARRGHQQEKRGLAIESRPHQRAGVDFLIDPEIRKRQRFKNPHGFREFIDLARLAGGEIRRFQAAGVVFPLRLAAGIGGGGVGFIGGLGKPLEAGPEFGADVFEQLGFHQAAASLARIGAGCQARVMLTVYVYQKCSTCRDALQWLDARGIPHQVKAIRETPPTPAELATALKAFSGDLRRIFNTSGIDYRALGLKDRLPAMTASEAFDLLSKNGNLVRRPFLIDGDKVLVGFKQADWENALRSA